MRGKENRDVCHYEGQAVMLYVRQQGYASRFPRRVCGLIEAFIMCAGTTYISVLIGRLNVESPKKRCRCHSYLRNGFYAVGNCIGSDANPVGWVTVLEVSKFGGHSFQAVCTMYTSALPSLPTLKMMLEPFPQPWKTHRPSIQSTEF